MSQAKVITKNGSVTPSGREKVMEVRSGKSGTGKVLGSVKYWPWSSPSCDAADRIVGEIAAKHGVELIYPELD